jgi:hypothetical protein
MEITKDLVVKIAGSVQTSNFSEYQKDVLDEVGKINTDLVTDEHFVEAESAIKVLKVTETRIANAKQDGINQTADIADLFTMMDKLSDSIRKTRLDLEKKVKSEKLARKNKIIDDGFNRVRDFLKSSPANHGYTLNIGIFQEAVKGKKSIEKMEDAVNEAVSNEIEAIEAIEVRVRANLEKIEESEKEFPGLFFDKKQIALSLEETVDALIESRVNKYKFDLAEKKRKEEEKAQQEKVEQPPPEPEKAAKVESKSIQAETEERFIITVEVFSTKEKALSVQKEIFDHYGGIEIVRNINISRG